MSSDAVPRTHHFKLPVRSEETLREYVRLTQGLLIPDKQVCPTHSTPWRAYCDAFFGRAPVMVWKASRGLGGKTQLLASLTKAKAELQIADVSVLGGTGEQSKRVLDAMGEFWKHPTCPATLIGEVKREFRLRNGAQIQALMASTTSTRGAHPQFLAIDEVDECDIEIVDSALGQPMDDPCRPWAEACTVLSSTHHYPDAAMTEIITRAADRGWPVHEWCIHETREGNGGWLTEKQIEKTRATMTSAQWENEVMLQEPSPDSRAIMPASVAAMFCRELGVFAGAPRQYIETEKPRDEGVYTHGADWAKSNDWTIIVTMRVDCKPARVVAFERLGREPWPAMIARLDDRVARYGGTAAHDATGGGSVVADLLKCEAAPFVMTGRNRADLIADYIGAIERAKIVAPFIAHMEAEHRLASRNIFRAGDEHLPDTIAAGALAWWAASSAPKWRNLS